MDEVTNGRMDAQLVNIGDRGEQRDGWTIFERHGKVVENVATDGQQIGKFGKVVESRRDVWSQN